MCCNDSYIFIFKGEQDGTTCSHFVPIFVFLFFLFLSLPSNFAALCFQRGPPGARWRRKPPDLQPDWGGRRRLHLHGQQRQRHHRSTDPTHRTGYVQQTRCIKCGDNRSVDVKLHTRWNVISILLAQSPLKALGVLIATSVHYMKGEQPDLSPLA